MSNTKLLSSLCYFSIFFAPLLLPAIIYFVTDEVDVRNHAKKSFISHIIPMSLLIAAFVLLSFSVLSFNTQSGAMLDGNVLFWGFAPLIFIVLYSLLFLVVLIWNVFQGIKVLK